MGAFDMVSDDDPRAVAHEESKKHRDCGKPLSEYTLTELQDEIVRRRKESINQRRADRAQAAAKRQAEKDAKQERYQSYLKLKEEFE